jgi:hypothetical protein
MKERTGANASRRENLDGGRWPLSRIAPLSSKSHRPTREQMSTGAAQEITAVEAAFNAIAGAE